uniref:Uncharacterized protein n=1 Tax=Globisporangium ultimum (strain ATCC 200006 / CBS 805.95 / DAOM BR144) TaxID=431595 RepID=K3X3P7_GLOUD
MSGSGVISQVSTEWFCSYRNKICPNKRAVKKNGELHQLCEEHRLRATQTQKRMMERRARGEQDEASKYEPSDKPMALTAEDLEALRLLSDSECACCNTQPSD